MALDAEIVEDVSWFLFSLEYPCLVLFPVLANDFTARETPDWYHHVTRTSPVGFLVPGTCTGTTPFFGFGLSNVVDEQRTVELHIGLAELGVARVLD